MHWRETLANRKSMNRPVAHKELSNKLRTMLLERPFRPDERLPTEAELSRDLGLSRQTVRKAFSDLVSEGLVYRVPGRGTFAVQGGQDGRYLRAFGPVDDILALTNDSDLEVLQPLARTIDIEAAGRMRQDTDEVYAGLFRREHTAGPFMITRICVPLDLGHGLADHDSFAKPGVRSPATMIEHLERDMGINVAGALQSITAESATPELCKYLECAPDSPVLRIDRLFFDVTGRFVELTVNHFNPSRYTYRVEVRRAQSA